MVGFSLAVLAGYGAARIAERLRSATTRRAVLTLVGVLMLVEYASTPLAALGGAAAAAGGLRRSGARRRRRSDRR